MPARLLCRAVAIAVAIGAVGCGDGGSDKVGAGAVEKYLGKSYEQPSCTERDVEAERKILPQNQATQATYTQVFDCKIEPKPGPLGETAQALVFLEKDGAGIAIFRSDDNRITGFDALDERLK